MRGGRGGGKYFWTFWEIINQSITINPGIILKTFGGLALPELWGWVCYFPVCCCLL